MEGSWRGLPIALIGVMCVLATGGCGDGSDQGDVPAGAIGTSSPARTFAPLTELPEEEPHRPASARWMIERSTLWYAEDNGCPDRKIAVGHMLAEQQNETIDWIYPTGLGEGPNYFRNPYGDRCRPTLTERHFADDLTRPHDPGPRLEGARDGQGYYLDLVDEYRAGEEMPGETPVYYERLDEGDSGVRLTYWMLFGMNAPTGKPAATHEGDWERVDVLLRDEGDGRYTPLALQIGADTAAPTDTPWSAVTLFDDTHPVVVLEGGSHAPSPGGRGACYACVRWRTWDALADATEQPWYGFGGAWGEPGPTDATTGPLGPHGHWLTANERERKIREQAGL